MDLVRKYEVHAGCVARGAMFIPRCTPIVSGPCTAAHSGHQERAEGLANRAVDELDELLAARCDSHMHHMLRSLTSLPSSAQHSRSSEIFPCNR